MSRGASRIGARGGIVGIEARSVDLLRDQSNATEKYQSMLKKQELTAQNGDLIQRKAGERRRYASVQAQ